MASAHEDEYNEGLVKLLELVWGEGFLAPGGADNVRQIIEGLDLRDKRVLDIGSGIGGVDMVLAGEFGARVIGLEIELPLIERARQYAERAGLSDRIEFRHVEPGPLPLADESIDVVFTSGVVIHIEDKSEMFAEILRVLRPGGVLAGYDWLRGPDEYSQDMYRWFELEGLTYAMDTLENYASMMREAGFTDVQTLENSAWYKARARKEYQRMNNELSSRLLELLGCEQRDWFVEDWRVMCLVLDKGELRTGRFRGFKPGA